MSLVITVYVPEGVVMAADSRLTIECQFTPPGCPTKQLSLPSSDSTYEVFLTNNGIGITACGTASVSNTPVGAILDKMIVGELKSSPVTPQGVADALLAHFFALPGPPGVRFHVAGYHDTDQQVFNVDVSRNAVNRVNNSGPGASWGGEADTLSRLLTRVAALDAQGAKQNEHPHFGVAFQHFTLQDAIDFAVYAIRTTSDTMRFQLRPQTVGGPIDVLVIRPGEARWLSRKELCLS
jgi:20S proteasome alpha/beta subunit